MERRNRQADLHPDAEPPVRRVEDDIRRPEWILRREKNSAVVHPSLELCVRWASYCEVPLEEVRLKRSRVVLVRRILHEFSDIRVDALDGRVFYVHRHCLWWWRLLPVLLVLFRRWTPPTPDCVMD